jgi:hypothetical protein
LNIKTLQNWAFSECRLIQDQNCIEHPLFINRYYTLIRFWSVIVQNWRMLLI